MPIRVGINKDVFIREAKYDTEKNWLIITFEEAGGQKFANAFERLGADEAVESLPTKDMYIFAPNEPFAESKDGKKKRTIQQMADAVSRDITSTKAILQHLMGGYMTSAELAMPGLTVMYAGTGMDANNYQEKIIKKEIYTLVHKNMSEFFIKMMTPFFGQEDKLFALLLVRQNAKVPYPAFRQNYIKENPFFEPMEGFNLGTKLAFTPYEIKEGLDNDLPVSRSDADKKSGETGAPSGGGKPMSAAEAFGG